MHVYPDRNYETSPFNNEQKPCLYLVGIDSVVFKYIGFRNIGAAQVPRNATSKVASREWRHYVNNCYVNITLVLTSFHRMIIRLWLPFFDFYNIVNGGVADAETWEELSLEKQAKPL